MYERPFVTCEDDMPNLGGLYNAFCAISSVPLMAAPILPLYRSMQRKLPFPATVQMVCMTGLFLSNLQHHTTYNNVFFVRISSYYNLASAYSMLTCVALPMLMGASKKKTPRFDLWRRDGPLLLILAVWATIQYSLSLRGSLELELQVYERVDGMCALVTIVVIGSAAKKISRTGAAPDQATLWNDFCWALVAFVVLNIAVPFEQVLCGLQGGVAIWLLKRTFHAVVLHALVALVFSSSANLSIRLIQGAAVVNLEAKKKP
jgi:hypothetical protein